MKTVSRFIHPVSAMFVLACVALSPTAHAVSPPPDGGYPGNNTAEGDNAFFSLTTGFATTANGFDALSSNTTSSFPAKIILSAFVVVVALTEAARRVPVGYQEEDGFQSAKSLEDRVKAIAIETFCVLEVILCWVVALPILLTVFFGFILREKIEKIRLAQSRHHSGADLPLRSSKYTETRPSSRAQLPNSSAAVAKQQVASTQQQKQIEALTAGLQKVSAAVELNKAALIPVADTR